MAGWPEKYKEATTSPVKGTPRALHDTFTVLTSVDKDVLNDLDVQNWPTWTTGDKPKWQEGIQNADKIMPYGELSYVISGKLEIVVDDETFIIKEGDMVTFPEGFQSSWRVLEELTWHYYLY